MSYKFALLLLLVFLVHWEGGGAAPRPPKFRIRGRGRADPGETVTLSCEFLRPSSASPSSYVWTKDGEVIPGETRDTLTLTPVTSQDTGIYQCGDPNSNLERLVHHFHVSGPKGDFSQESGQAWKVNLGVMVSFIVVIILVVILFVNRRTSHFSSRYGQTEANIESSTEMEEFMPTEKDAGAKMQDTQTDTQLDMN